ncbi:unnamed protein product [Sphagnum tenellum]
MESTSTTSGSGNVSKLTTGLILSVVTISIVATSKLLWHLLYSRGQTSQTVNPGAENTGTDAHTLVQVQRNEVVHLASSSPSTDGTTTNVVAAVPTPANNEVQVQVVIEDPPSIGHPTDAQNPMAHVFTATYRMMLDYMFSTFASGTVW